MKGDYLGEFEEIVLLIVAQLGDNAYGVSGTEEITKQTKRNTKINAVHETLNRFKEEGPVNTKIGRATAERSGKRKRFNKVTSYESQILHEVIDKHR